MFQLENDIWFWLLFVPLGMLLLFLWTQLWKKRTKRKFSDLKLLKRLSPDQSLFKSVLKFITLSLGFLLNYCAGQSKNWHFFTNCKKRRG